MFPMISGQELFDYIRRVGKPYKRNMKRLFRAPNDFRRNRIIIKRIKNKSNKIEVINVLFILQYPEMWNTYRSIYAEFLNDLRFDCTILAVPKQIGVNNSNGRFDQENVAVDFCKKNNLKYVDTGNEGRWMDINILSPDLIFIQRPYDECMPNHLSLEKLSVNSMIIYVPYGYEFVNNIHLDIEYNDNFINNVFYCFAENDDTVKYIKKRSMFDTLFGIRKVFNLGYPRFDLINQKDENCNSRKNILWTPRWSLSEINDKSHFLDYIEILKTYFSKNKDLNLIIRPHPLMFKNFIEKGVFSKEKLEELKDEIDLIDNIEWDNNQNYLDTFNKVDILISDFSSIIIEFFATNKPIIYCGGFEGFNNVGRQMMKGLYHASNDHELISMLEYLTCNYDKFFEINRDTISKYIKKDNRIGASIKDEIVKCFI